MTFTVIYNGEELGQAESKDQANAMRDNAFREQVREQLDNGQTPNKDDKK